MLPSLVAGYSHHIRQVTNQFIIIIIKILSSHFQLELGKYFGHGEKMPTAMQVRRYVSNIVALKGTLKEVEEVAKHISHLPQTSFKYV